MRIDSLLGAAPHAAPGRIALADSRRTLTYGQLGAVVKDEAEFLRASGGLRFGLLAENGCAWAVSDLALLHLERLNVPLPPYFTAAQQRHAIDDAGLDALVTDRPEKVVEQWPEFWLAGLSPASGLAVLRRTVDVGARRDIPSDVTKITYTSGSTAEPKGVCLSTAAIDRVTRSLVEATRPIGLQRHLCLMPLPTLLENLAGVHAPLRAGVSCIVPAGPDCGMSYGSLDPQRLLKTLLLYRPESVVIVPELLRLLVRAAQGGHALPDSLKFIAVGGAPVARSLLEEAAELGLPVYEGYGLSECSSVVCLNTPRAARLGSVGRPLAHARIAVDDGGQLRAGGAVMSCYLGEPPGQPQRDLATGDLGEIDEDGYVYIRGRLRNIFITSFGRNVSPEWVEKELSHEPAIRLALACGEGLPGVRALVCPAGPDVDGAILAKAVARANERLPDYARVRGFARMPETPTYANGLLTGNGRLRRERILERFGKLLDEAA